MNARLNLRRLRFATRRDTISEVIRLLLVVMGPHIVYTNDPLLVTGPYIVYNDDERDCISRNQLHPLHLAAQLGYAEVVLRLHDDDPDRMTELDSNHNTAMHLAARFGHLLVIELLAELGSPINFRNHAGLTPLDLAEQENQTEAVELLLELNGSM
jgi:hypothetical protein